VTQRGGVMMLVGGEAAPGRGKEGDDANWADTNLTGPKNEKKNYTVDSAATNGR
jgi:hypothetical protein